MCETRDSTTHFCWTEKGGNESQGAYIKRT
jgi:hypothetical protein